jgi:hypothetical protein
MVLLFAAACLVAFDGNGAPTTPAAPAPYPALPSTEISTFINRNLATLLAPLPPASVIEKAPPPGAAPKAAKGKKKKKAKKNNAANANQADDAADDTATDGDPLMVPTSVRTQTLALDTQLSTQAGTAAPEEKSVYQQAITIAKLFTEISDARDAQITAIQGILKQKAETEAAATGTVETGKAAAADNTAAAKQMVEQANNDINDVDTQWLKTAAGYQQEVDYQMDQLRALERAALMGPAAPAPKA